MSRAQRLHKQDRKLRLLRHSKPTMCLGCHLIVEMVLFQSEPAGFAEHWRCPRCQKKYFVTDWKIKAARTA